MPLENDTEENGRDMGEWDDDGGWGGERGREKHVPESNLYLSEKSKIIKLSWGTKEFAQWWLGAC